MADNIAIKEMERLKRAHAWSPVHKVIKRKRNQHVCKYTFEDGSVLGVYLNGDASWFFRKPNGDTAGEQRWPMWHYCNK